MTTSRRHPGATGVAPWVDWYLSDGQKADLAVWMRAWNLERVDEAAMLESIETYVRIYKGLKILARDSSAGAVRRNLRAATKAAGKLAIQLNALDGNSLQILQRSHHASSIKHEAVAIHRRLHEALSYASTQFALRGPRPEDERVTLASWLADALRNHTSARPTATRGGVFEDLLLRAFELADETYADLHTLAERTLKQDRLSRQDGLVSVSA